MKRGVAAVALVLALASGAQAEGDDALSQARAAQARLDFAAAYSALAAAIAERPDAPDAYLARAALHRTLDRPALALADLDRARRRAPEAPEAEVATGDIWLENNAFSRAIRAYDAALARAPDHLPALVGRARAYTRAGLVGNALADYDRALALAPDDAALAAARDAIVNARAARQAETIRYDPAALMAPEFRIEQGPPGADAHLVIVEVGTDLAARNAEPDPAALARALETGALRLTRLFTYTGEDSAIWANLALICGGSEAFETLRTTFRGEAGRTALAAIGASGDLAPLKALVAEAYAGAGVDAARVESCAFDRGMALRYLADWSEKHDSHAWKGVNFYDYWPVLVWNDAPLPADEVNARLQALAPPPEASIVAEPVAVATEDPGEDDATPPDDPAPAEAVAPDAQDAPDGDTAVDAPATADLAPPPMPPAPAPVTAQGSVPAELRGIYAPGLVECLAYDARRAAAQRLDDILPAVNPLDGPPVGTILLTSRRLHLFNATDTECGLAALPETDAEAPWQAGFACTNALAKGVIAPLGLVRVDGEGPAPRLEARLGEAPPVPLVQCRAFGLLGRDAGPLWRFDATECRLRAEVAAGGFTFEVGPAGHLMLRLQPEAAGAGEPPRLWLDGTAWDDGRPTETETGWQVDLGPFSGAAERLGLGLFLEAAGGGAPGRLRLPLLGSAAAMAQLAACAPGAGAAPEP
ncbi:hypothetical protein GCM10011358_28540 [Sinisalibacter lacisalsi]|uniref:Tetratricopeptide repeat protein n=2 Tax=Sinisalibacter lacisalsi TaxID=1526570 RepID=A0ABQ1QU46_9RHOB|nr:hypothetical protein GCM10011358_28540 [Sinisalibacter lacisalsi]